ncbi:CRISPR-associated helicase Cas3' [Laspinema olomoucense]|uniref:CRISPR-associated helicase Cas3' n=1 Tax=Laspinema olomoucense TaxID=3231600 RepID=UPI0021BA6128|nr:CRISPR-associated helicase Cas3' [Laspinema sp. D3c]MCT7995550.1 CRISPR-associated helicase Cas3' [Laspinema sp. D3c]
MECHEFPKLLAKSLPKQKERHPKAEGAATYTGHIYAVMKSAEVLVEKLGSRILEQLDLKDIEPERFAATVKLGAYLHDWGKANQHFQEMVYLKSEDDKIPQGRKQLLKAWKQHGERQMIRHEVISGILALQVPGFREWLSYCPNADLLLAVWAAMGHHLKMEVKDSPIIQGTGTSLNIYTKHSDFKSLLKMGIKFLGLPKSKLILPKENWSVFELEVAFTALVQEFTQAEKQMDEQQKKFIAAVKATVLAADMAGSALAGGNYEIEEWVEEVLSRVLSEEELQNVLTDRLEGQELREFQKQIAAPGRRIKLVKAGCGTGKTIGAYAWAKTRAIDSKLFFCYPTMGTASQGYLDYAHDSEIEATLMHSHAEIDLEELLTTKELEETEEDRKNNEEVRETESRITSLLAWQHKLMVCTIDTVLGLMQNNRKPLYSWPAISQAAFVFDEVHAYDSDLFGALLRFLQTFRGAEILMMSASITREQERAIRKVVEELGETITVINGPKELEQVKRYRLYYLPEVSDPKTLPEIWPKVLNVLKQGGKVLWVTNSVQTCIDLYRLAEKQLSEHLPGVSVQRLIYHSRFRYQDRKQKHEAVIEAFKGTDPVLAITTQVCEMSLDLSADLLVSAIAPAPALIQRLGRLNRRGIQDEKTGEYRLVSGKVCDAIIYPWNAKQPYKKSELDTGKALIDRLAGGEISQQDLSEVAAELGSMSYKPVDCEWLDGIWATRPGALRNPGYTVTVLLQDDIAKITQAAKNSDRSFMKEAQNWAVSIRPMPGFQKWKRKKFYRCAPSDVIQYSEETGAEPCKPSP